MGTRAILTVKEDDKVFCYVYTQGDGYPDGYGQKIFDFLNERILTNGISGGSNHLRYLDFLDDRDFMQVVREYDGKKYAQERSNGMGELAAQIVTYLKGTSVGNIYLTNISGTKEDDHIDYAYVLEGSFFQGADKQALDYLKITAYSWGEEIFSGSVREFGQWLEDGADAEDDE